jgi:drug/metabolite transporter (DMT)-like permease
MGLLYAFIADVFLFNEVISFTEVCGALVILTVTCWVSVVKIRDSQKKKAKELVEMSESRP